MKNPATEGGEQFSERYEAAQENSDILSLIEKVKSGSYLKGDAVSLGTIDAKNASEIKKITGIDVTGYEVILEPRMIDHILTDHGEHGKTDHSMANASDIAKMEYALQNATSIVDGGTTNAYVSFINGRNRPAKTVLYEAPIGKKSYYVVEAVPVTTKNKLFIVTAFIGQQGYKKGAKQFTDANGPGATSKNAAAFTPNASIAQENGKSNTAERKNSDRDTEYLELAKDPEKNAARLQEMVDEAAEAAMPNIKLCTKNNRAGLIHHFSQWKNEHKMGEEQEAISPLLLLCCPAF